MYERKLNKWSFAVPKKIRFKPDKRSDLLLLSVLYLLLFSLFSIVNWQLAGNRGLFLGIASFPILAYILAQVLFSRAYRPQPANDRHPSILNRIRRPRIAVILTLYNEEPWLVKKAVRSLLTQNAAIDEIYLIDDGSEDLSAFQAIEKMKKEWEKNHKRVSSDSVTVSGKADHTPKWILHRFPANRGKRQAQAWAFRKTNADVIVTVDSDSILEPEAVRELIQPLLSRDVMAVAGHIGVTNGKKNLLTRLTDLHYEYIFRTECAAHSATGNILYCSGPLAAFRREVIENHLNAYLNQTFWGRPVQIGDDRFLTGLANLKGRTVYQSTARCTTRVPETWRHFLVQQLRWARSFIMESLSSLRNYACHKRIAPFLWTLGEFALWPLFGLALALDIAVHAGSMGWTLLLFYLGYMTAFAYLRNLPFLFKHPRRYLWLCPLHGLLQFGVITLIRFWALFTLRSTAWGMR